MGGVDSWLKGVEGTFVLWAISGALSLVIAGVLVALGVSRWRLVRLISSTVINVTRGVPTSLVVIVGGIAAGRLALNRAPLPQLFPHTPAGFQATAWTIATALALGSSGHLAVIMRSAYETLGAARRHQARLLGLRRRQHGLLLMRESAVVAAAPVTNRMVHHLHNTAFAGLFPVVEIFGVTEKHANDSFRVVDVVLVAVAIYAGLSCIVWMGGRAAERALSAQPGRQTARRQPRAVQPAPTPEFSNRGAR